MEVIGILISSEIENLLIYFKMVFYAQKGVAQPCSRLPFCGGHNMRVGPTWDKNLATPAVF